jgi:hemerythrin-like domain-containing protein
MQTEISTLMAELREDHRNMAIVLDLLDRVIDDIRNENDDVLELLAEIMHYMTVYPDAVHHPKEDLVYGQLQQHRPDLSSGLENVADDHKEIAELGVQLRNDIDAIESGTAVRRQQLIDDAASYVQRLRNHMQWEEADLFPRIDRMLESKSQPLDLTEFRSMRDPVFGASSQAGFRRLMESLKP